MVECGLSRGLLDIDRDEIITHNSRLNSGGCAPHVGVIVTLC